MLILLALTCSLLAAVAANNGGTPGGLDPANVQKALAALPDLGRRSVGAGGVPGVSVAVVYDGKTQYAEGFGVRKVGESALVDAQTVFQLASVSKPLSSSIVSAIISQSQGDLSWTSLTNSPGEIARYPDPWVSAQLQLNDGFSHRSGIWGPAGEDLELVGFAQSTIFERLRYATQIGPFRAFYSYSNYGLTVAATSAARTVGLLWADAAQKYIYGPLGMSSTSSKDADFVAKGKRATLHYPTAGTAASANRTWVAAAHRDPDAQGPAGGASSNVVDLAKWVQFLLAKGKGPSGERIADEAVLAESWRPTIVRGLDPITNDTGFYALGWDVDYRDGFVYLSHAGAFEQGVRTLVKLNIEQGLGIVVLANAFPTGWPEGIADTVFDIATYGSSRRDYVGSWNGIYTYFDQIYTDNPFAADKPGTNNTGGAALGAEAYVGEYSNSYVGRVSVTSRTGSGAGVGAALDLRFLAASSNKTFALSHWDRDTFLFSGTQPSQNSGATFVEAGGDGRASKLVLSQFEASSGGVLMRV